MSEPVRASAHRAPDGVSDTTVEGVGKLSEAFEYVERARGHLYSFHQLMGRADFLMEDAADELVAAGHHEQADFIRGEIIGRNVLDGRWTYQVVEEFDDHYYEPVKRADERVRNELVGGRRHLFEAELKEQRRTRGRPRHESEPAARHGAA